MLKETLRTTYTVDLTYVLILILMEHAQRASFGLVRRVFSASLNPYFNGTCSKSQGWQSTLCCC